MATARSANLVFYVAIVPVRRLWTISPPAAHSCCRCSASHVQAGAIWLRISAAAFNDIEDYERLVAVVARVVREAD